MNIEEIFKGTTVNKKHLLIYGFKQKQNKYEYSKIILNNKFKINVIITPPKEITYHIYDLETNEEYFNHKIEKQTGPFITSLRNTITETLNDIKNKCFQDNYFISNQANRITNKIIEKYGNKPEFLWKKSPKDGIFRNQTNKKWYALIMNIEKNKIDKNNGKIDILNIKLPETKINQLIIQKGYYKAYHMNKKYWITISLDDTLSDEEILNHIEESYNNVNDKIK